MSTIQSHCSPGHSTLPSQPCQTVGTSTTTRVPHTCPVCGGRGTVGSGFYSRGYGGTLAYDTAGETCRTCEGRGIVWETRHEYQPAWVYPPSFTWCGYDAAAAPPHFTVTSRTYQSTAAGGVP